MDSKSLMIGDWVEFASKYGYGTGQIAAIEPREGSAEPTTFSIIKNKQDGSHFYVGVSKNCVRPIPLTAEILEKNGFKKLVTYCTEKWISDDIRMNIYTSDGCWRFCADTKRNENSVIYIHFIHELQHALRLCGIEKEIVL